MFDSTTAPIPPLRYDVQVIEVAQDGKDYLLFHDQLGYATRGFAIPAEMEPILSLIDGSRSIEQILPFTGDGVSAEELLEYVRFLDQHRLLDSEYFAEQAEKTEEQYESAEIHHSSTAGGSYPEDPDELKEQLDQAFEQYENSTPVDKATALYAPHIDPRIGMESYVKAFSAIRELKPLRVIMLGTSHYSGLYGDLYNNRPFIVSDKTFRLPNGDVHSDIDLIQRMRSELDEEEYGLSFSDRAHRIEHSLELHLLYLNHIWDHDFQILPVLVGGAEDLLYTHNSYRQKQVDRFSSWLSALADDQTFFLISGDLAHIGKKFGDSQPASELFDNIRQFDNTFLKLGSASNSYELLEHMREDLDPYRICGFPPLYSFLSMDKPLNGEILSYDIWDERERESAVSFGSILFS